MQNKMTAAIKDRPDFIPKIEYISVDLLEPNEGQYSKIDEVTNKQVGLGRNPRWIRDSRYEALKKSITDDPEYLLYHPLEVFTLSHIKGKDGKYKITISQDTRSKGFEPIKNLLTRYGFAMVKQSETKYHFTKTNKELGEYLAQFGRSAEKFIPEEIKNASIEQRKVFLRAYYYGDGFTHEKRGYSQITTISHRMADDLQEMLSLCGISASISERKDSVYDVILHKSKNGEWKRCAKLYQHQIFEEDYDGEVYCVNVPTTALVVRRNKHIAISGNCKTMRGAKKKGTMTSSYLTGVFKTESALRAEFLNFVRNK